MYKVAQARYGAWIAPSGQMFDAPSDRGHDSVAIDILKKDHGLDMNSTAQTNSMTERMMDLGYLRFIYIPFCVEARVPATSTQKVKVMQLINSSEARKFTFQSRSNRLDHEVEDVISARALARKL